MTRFEIRDDFYLDGKPFKILSGAIHYFRIPPEDWYHSLYNLKALGFNTVETYVAWNLHEPREGEFHFEGALDLERFLQTAQDLGLYAIVRPSPFICAEWEFGGLPAWLLTKDMRIRSSDPAYIEAVGRYYDQLLPRLVPHLLDNGGNILMMQVENEYGSYGEDKAYLRAIRQLMEERGVTCPLFTSDGPWRATLKAGTLIEDDLFVTGNFGSKAPYNFSQMQEFFDEHGKKWPLMCMEFWDGWFNRWKEPIITRDPTEFAVKAERFEVVSSLARKVLDNAEDVKELVDLDFNRVIYLGAGPFFGLAHEAQLKILELTAGQVATMYESPVGFRHGPKSLINEDTVVLVFGTTTDYTRKYDLDLVREVAGDQIARRVVLLSDQSFGLENVKEVALGCGGVLNDIYRVFPYIVYAQLFALLTSLKVENKPDTPSPTGTVNRVVQGVIIHEYQK